MERGDSSDSDDEILAEEDMGEGGTEDLQSSLAELEDYEGEDDDMENGGGGGEYPEEDGENGEEGSGPGAPPVDDAFQVFRGHRDSVYAVACSTAPFNRVASGGGDDVAFLWTLGEAREPLTLRGHSDSVAALAFSNDGALLASGGLDGALCIWDSASGEAKHKLEGPSGGIEWCSWHPRGSVVVAGSEDFSSWMWNAASGVCMGVFTGHSGAVSCGAFSPDGKTLVTGSADASIRVWDPRNATTVTTFSGHTFHSDAVTCLDLRADGVGVSGSADRTAAVFSTQTNKVAGKLTGHEDSMECVSLHSSLPIVATGGTDNKLCLWDLNTFQSGVVQLSWHPTHPELILSGCTDGSVHVWDGRSGTSARTFLGHREAVLSMAVTIDGLFVVTGSDDKTCRVFGF